MVEVVKRAWTNHRVLVEENFTQSKGDAWGERYVVQGAVTDHVPIWVFPKIGVPQNGWFIMENPIKFMIWEEQPLFFGDTHIVGYVFSCSHVIL